MDLLLEKARLVFGNRWLASECRRARFQESQLREELERVERGCS